MLKILKKVFTFTIVLSLLLSLTGIALAETKAASLKKVYLGSRTLYQGSRGTDVVELQNFLKTKGFFKASSTGYFGPITKKAILAFQKKANLKVTGTLNSETVLIIRSETAKAKKPVKPAPIPVAQVTPKLESEIILATTTSTEDSGLLDVLVPAFTAKTGVKVKVIAVGTGQALQLGKDGNADVLLVHARKDENAFVSEGYGVNAWDVMYNQFYLVGPEADPAKVFGNTSIVDTFKKIAQTESKLVSRGDNSGTHKKELSIWTNAGIKPEGKWYISAGQGMGATLLMADEMGAYTLADEATFLTAKTALKIAVAGDAPLLNPYGVIKVKVTKKPHASDAFINYITGAEGQKVIENFGKAKYGKSLFNPSAKKR